MRSLQVGIIYLMIRLIHMVFIKYSANGKKNYRLINFKNSILSLFTLFWFFSSCELHNYEQCKQKLTVL